MGLFDKKYCGVCGQKIGLFGNRKLEDANLCKQCAAKLSPWFSDRRRSTLADIKEQLAYREENKEKVAAFHPTLTLGKNAKVIIDEDAQKFIVTGSRNWQNENPDVIDIADVTGCQITVEEGHYEKMQKDAEGKEVPYSPRRFTFSQVFHCTISVNNPYFSQIGFRLNTAGIVSEAIMYGGTVHAPITAEYRDYEKIGEEIKNTLMGMRNKAREQAAKQAEPKKPVVCPFCGATTMPDASGCCEYCGAPIN